jgi:hypothetical protein
MPEKLKSLQCVRKDKFVLKFICRNLAKNAKKMIYFLQDNFFHGTSKVISVDISGYIADNVSGNKFVMPYLSAAFGKLSFILEQKADNSLLFLTRWRSD